MNRHDLSMGMNGICFGGRAARACWATGHYKCLTLEGSLGKCSKALKMFISFDPRIHSVGFYPMEITGNIHKNYLQVLHCSLIHNRVKLGVI